jgi:hypothetical protein
MRLAREFTVYVARIREFDTTDWVVYLLWVGTITGLVAATGGFLLAGHLAGVVFPAEIWLVPGGAALFAVAIAIDTIGHRTVYREAIRGAEALVHHVTIFCGVASVVLLCLAYDHRSAVIPALAFTALSLLYSLIDEVLHWRRYLMQRTDRIEMISHMFILAGHSIMMLAWWRWYQLGYPGVARTLEAFAR